MFNVVSPNQDEKSSKNQSVRAVDLLARYYRDRGDDLSLRMSARSFERAMCLSVFKVTKLFRSQWLARYILSAPRVFQFR
jgi:hypothetical protein